MELKLASLLQVIGFSITVVFLGLLKSEVIKNIVEALRQKIRTLVLPAAGKLLDVHGRSRRFFDSGDTIKSYIYLLFTGPILVLLIIVLLLPVSLLKRLSILFSPHDMLIKVIMIWGIIITFTGLIMELIIYW